MKKRSVISVEDVKRHLEGYCVYQDRCHQEVHKKMREYNLIPQAKDAILLHLLEHDFLNEERFSKSFARGKFRIKQWGRVRIVRELKMRQISEYNIKTALKEIDEKDYIDTLYRLTEKKYKSLTETNVYKQKKKLVDFLNYRGFESHLIFNVVNEFVTV